MFHINRTGRIGRSRKFNSLSLRSKIKANPNNVLLNRRRVRLGRIKASSYNSSLKPGSIRHAGKEASAHNLSLKRGNIFRGLFNMAKCKACTKVMQTVVKAMGKDLGKVNLVNYFIAIKFHTSFDFFVYSVELLMHSIKLV